MIVFQSATSVIAESAECTEEVLGTGNLGDNMIGVLDSSDAECALEEDEVLPSSYDISSSNSFPCVRSQSWLNSCASWSTTYYQFGYQVAEMNDWDAKNDPTKQLLMIQSKKLQVIIEQVTDML